MSTHPHGQRAVVVHPDSETLYEASAARLLLGLLDAQSVRDPVHLAIAGGSVGEGVLGAALRSPLLPAVDFTGVHLWWVDERFVAADSPDRNDLQARAFCEAVGLPQANVHPMPSAGPGSDADAGAAAARYASLLGESAAGARFVFDLVLLGMGPDGHIASLFPGSGSLDATEALVVAEYDSPKPPPVRLSVTLPVINAARQVWLVVAGAAKADAVAAALQGTELPAGRVHGQDVTLWLLDAAAAGQP